ncbi:MAG TPA: hypothetical protein VM734_05140 [Kofleriaceae bacterium]|jgi:DNA-3-methyladenine glycosylase II|nr:hypothetical protein [Kofleriaceae bacterium]
MQLHLAARAPFELARSIDVLRRFPPCRGDYVLTDDSITAAVSVRGRALAFRLSAAGPGRLAVDLRDDLTPGEQARVAQLAGWFVSADDDLAGFYAAAAGDAPVFRARVAALHGLHQVRFLTLAEIAVYAVLMQRTPIGHASRLKRRFLERFGSTVLVGETSLHAMPELDALRGLDAADYHAAIGHRAKAAALPAVVRGVAALGEDFLRTAPHAEARAALLAIPGVGPFSAAAILVRGLGRMDDLPLDHEGFARPARELYGAAYDPRAIVRRYGRHLGYWSYYVKASP